MKLNFFCEEGFLGCDHGHLVAEDISVAFFPHTPSNNHEGFHKEGMH
jgi:hypothetical protein